MGDVAARDDRAVLFANWNIEGLNDQNNINRLGQSVLKKFKTFT